MPDWPAILTAIGILIGIVIPSAIAFRVARSAAKQSDIKTLQDGYRELQKTYSNENARLHNELEAERLARRADRLSCETQIANLSKQIGALHTENIEQQRQLTVLLAKMPEPGHVQQVKITGATGPLAVAVVDPHPLPVELIRPIPLPMTAAEAKAAREEKERE